MSHKGKMFTQMESDFFGEGNEIYHVSSYFFRVEFQQRGAPHIHSLLWLKDKNNKDAPNFWIDEAELTKSDEDNDSDNDNDRCTTVTISQRLFTI